MCIFFFDKIFVCICVWLHKVKLIVHDVLWDADTLHSRGGTKRQIV